MNQHPIALNLSFPEPDFKISSTSGKQMIWDRIRKKEIILTPEEWVRQNFILYLTKTLRYPAGLISVEKQIKVGDLLKRYDIVVYRHSEPWMIIECKETGVPINQKVLEQILAYNITLQTPYLILTNGPVTLGIRREKHSWAYLKQLPEWSD